MAAVQLGKKAAGTVVKIKENGVYQNFEVLALNYPANGRVLLWRKLCCDEYLKWNNEGFAPYKSSTIDTWLNSTYLNRIDSTIRSQIAAVNIPCYTFAISGIEQIARKVFFLSALEVGVAYSEDQYHKFANEGSKIPYLNSNERRKASNAPYYGYWLRTHAWNTSDYRVMTIAQGGDLYNLPMASSAGNGVRPAFTLPSTLWVGDDGVVFVNNTPTISGSNQNLGNKNTNFNISYSVNDIDSSDALTITEKRDNTTIRTINNATRNLTYTIPITITGVTLGAHTVTITVSDGKGGTATRTYTFTRVNAAPTISGSDQSLGAKNKGFVLTYRVADADNDALTVTEKLNSKVLQTINNAPKNTDITLEISDAEVYALALDSSNTITIEARDPNGGVAYRNYTFTRVNAAPTISGADETLGTVEEPFSREYVISDIEGDVVTVTELVDDTTIRTFEAVHGETNTITLPAENWRVLPNGQHTLKVEAVDAKGAKSVRLYQFSKNETSVLFTLAAPIAADAQPKKILISPIWSISGGTAKVEACNNAFDDAPAWEDITAQVLVNRHYNFLNAAKTTEQWGINIRFTIVKNDGYDGEISVNGFGGAFE
ncbi:DUF6273 domain-containing protein [Harryflintia acetispora]|uniref:DUF6273 domain-containing protein n=1 Tax=Harryflintia acetispora TaxID=1849041 RepID=UPI001899465B|nr:DUF6273 domain-containing protein [Harryflintia acetispora]